MAWTAPRTWVTGETVTAALMNTHVRDNLTAGFPDGATSVSWTPVVSGSVSGSTPAADKGREYQIGPVQFAWAHWTLLTWDPGNSLDPDGILAVLGPSAPANIEASSAAGQVVGHWRIYDASASATCEAGVCFFSTATQSIRFARPVGVQLTSTNVIAAVVAGDMFSISLCYPVA